MLRWHHRNGLARDVDAKPHQLFINVREMPLHKIRGLVADVQMDIVKPVALNLRIIGARHDIARRKLCAFVIIGHIAMPGFGIFQYTAFAAHCLGNEEVFHLKIVQAGRVKLHEFHIRYAAARAPRHRNAITRRPAWCGGIEIGPSGTPAGQYRGPRGERFHLPRLAVERIDAMDAS